MNISNKQLEKFIENRKKLIQQLEDNTLSKLQFLEYNYELINKLNMKPIVNISNINEGIYSYQYYNILAKIYKQKALKATGRNKEKKYNENIIKSNNYYFEKDKCLRQLLNYVDFSHVEAYYVKMYSKRLDSNIYEIVLNNVEMAIFHSMNDEILNLLKEKKVFDDTIKESKINDYINSKI